jgi:hypothetical protein
MDKPTVLPTRTDASLTEIATSVTWPAGINSVPLYHDDFSFKDHLQVLVTDRRIQHIGTFLLNDIEMDGIICVTEKGGNEMKFVRHVKYEIGYDSHQAMLCLYDNTPEEEPMWKKTLRNDGLSMALSVFYFLTITGVIIAAYIKYN